MSWPIVMLGEIAKSVDYGLTASATDRPVGPKFLRITDIQDDAVDWDSVPYCNADSDQVARNRLAHGDIVFARTGATTGKSFLVRNPPNDAVFASYLIRVRASERLDSVFLAHFFRSPNYWGQIERAARGAAQPGVNASVLKEIRIPLPALEEQRRIAAILDVADAIRRKREQTLADIDAFIRATFFDLFGDLAKNVRGYPLKPLSDLVDPDRPVTYGILMPGPDTEDGVPYIRVTDIQDGRVVEAQVRRTTHEIAREYRRSTLRPWDLLMSIRGHVGRLAFVPETLDGSNITQDTARLAVRSKVDAIYLRACLESPSFQRLMRQRTKGGAVKGINLGDVKALRIPIGPEKSRKRFFDVWLRCERLLSESRVSVANSEQLLASLSQRAFRGEL